MAPNVAPKVRVRGMILTIGIAAITIVGTLYGAGLKAEREVTEKRKRVVQPGAEDELISALETRRAGLVQAKRTWETKAQVLRERMASHSQRTLGGGSSGGNSSSSSSSSSSAPTGK